MLSSIRKRATFANVAMTLALVFAMAGGAYAAKRYVITSTKQIKPSVLKALKGTRGIKGATGIKGANGLNGANGAAGPQGEKGPKGDPGEKGAAGESVAAKAIAAGDTAKCDGLGGVDYTLGGKTTTVCNGQTGFTETLPSGKTEKGAWALTTAESPVDHKVHGQGAISFGIPLATEPTVHFIDAEAGEPPTAECPGSVANPEAAKGMLCVYEEVALASTLESPKVYTSGAVLRYQAPAPGITYRGTWAVTAE